MRGQVIRRGVNTFLIRIPTGRDAVGKRTTFNKTFHGTKRGAEELRVKLLREHQTGVLYPTAKLTVGDCLDRWIESKVDVRPRTRHDYQAVITAHLKPTFGQIKVDVLTPRHVQDYVNMSMQNGKGARTIKLHRDILHMALSRAVLQGELLRAATSPQLVKLPSIKRREATVWNQDQARRFLEHAGIDRWAALWHLLLTGGLRPSEALALSWRDVNWEMGTVTIERSLTRWTGGLSFGNTKSKAGNRRVPLPATTVELLRRHRVNQLADKLKAGSSYNKLYDLVFATQLGEPLEYRVLVRRHFKRIIEAAGLPRIRPYDLRHTSATLAIDMGTSIKVLADRLGHSDIKMTLSTYQHSLPHHQDAVAVGLEQMLYPIREAKVAGQ